MVAEKQYTLLFTAAVPWSPGHLQGQLSILSDSIESSSHLLTSPCQVAHPKHSFYHYTPLILLPGVSHCSSTEFSSAFSNFSVSVSMLIVAITGFQTHIQLFYFTPAMIILKSPFPLLLNQLLNPVPRNPAQYTVLTYFVFVNLTFQFIIFFQKSCLSYFVLISICSYWWSECGLMAESADTTSTAENDIALLVL